MKRAVSVVLALILSLNFWGVAFAKENLGEQQTKDDYIDNMLGIISFVENGIPEPYWIFETFDNGKYVVEGEKEDFAQYEETVVSISGKVFDVSIYYKPVIDKPVIVKIGEIKDFSGEVIWENLETPHLALKEDQQTSVILTNKTIENILRSNLGCQVELKGCVDIRPNIFLKRTICVFKVNNIEPKYSDLTADHWAYQDICFLVANGIINGYADHTIRPQLNVSRAEFISLVNRALGKSPINYVKTHEIWYEPEVITAQDSGYFLLEWKDADMNTAISREEAFQVLYLSLDAPLAEGKEKFTDIQNAKYQKAIWHLDDCGIINGFPDGTIRPQTNLRRAESFHLIYKFLGKISSNLN